MVTDWFPPETKPTRYGWYDGVFYDCGWAYEYRIWFDGYVWRDGPEGWALSDQQQTWRGQLEQTA